MGTFDEESSTVVGATATLEEAVVCLSFGAMSTVKIFEEVERKGRDFLVL